MRDVKKLESIVPLIDLQRFPLEVVHTRLPCRTTVQEHLRDQEIRTIEYQITTMILVYRFSQHHQLPTTTDGDLLRISAASLLSLRTMAFLLVRPVLITRFHQTAFSPEVLEAQATIRRLRTLTTIDLLVQLTVTLQCSLLSTSLIMSVPLSTLSLNSNISLNSPLPLLVQLQPKTLTTTIPPSVDKSEKLRVISST